ncbi:MAG: redoxin domain-containing protein [Bacteroidales bacterium]|nr:redoxin domain-containing protein [Bacteroidales bacterium]
MFSIFRRILLIFLLTFAPIAMMSQVKIRVEIENLEDSLFYLLKYKSDKTYTIIDTTLVPNQKKVFKNKTNYPEGIYLLADSKQNPIFELFLGKDQKFTVNVGDLTRNETYIIKGAKETSDYFDIYARTNYNRLYIKALESEIEYFPDNARKIDSIKLNHNEYLESIKIKDRNSFLKTYIGYNKEIIVPQEYKNKSEQYIIDHYFDDKSLSDVRILNTRLLKNKLDDYFNNYLSKQSTNVILQKIDYLIGRTTSGYRDIPQDLLDHNVRDYILWYLYSKYFDNDLIYIHLSDVYFSKLEINNLTENIRNEIVKRADILREITIGHLAPTFTYIDDEGKQIDLSEINSKNTVLFFYKPDCQRCIRDKRTLEKIKNNHKDLSVLYINISEENYSNVSQDIAIQYDIKTTPTIYILDKDKRIIAKNIKAEDIEFHLIKR